MNRDKLLMLVATAARMGVGMLTFVVMAHSLDPAAFGVLATAIAYAAFVSVVSDYGLGISALRLASAEPERAGEIVTHAMVTKLLLSALVAVVFLGGAAVLRPAQLGIYAMALVGCLTYAFGDLQMIAARARQRFDVEAVIVTTTSVVIMLLVGGTALLTHSTVLTAAAFMISRIIYLVTSGIVLRRWLGIAIGWRCSVEDLKAMLARSSTYAVDAILTTLSSQVDVLLFGAVLAAHDIGIYQSGARLVQVIMPFAVALATVYMPTLAAAALNSQPEVFRQNSRRINIEFTALAIIGTLGFIIVGPVFTKLVYGSRYDALIPLWRGFGVFVMLRMGGACYGIQLSALGFIRTRITAQIASVAAFVVLAAVALPHYGLPITSWLLAGASVPSTLVLWFAMFRDERSDASALWSLVVMAAVSIACVII